MLGKKDVREMLVLDIERYKIIADTAVAGGLIFIAGCAVIYAVTRIFLKLVGA